MAIKDNGFTLIEILVAFTIIGALAAIAIPEFRNFKARSYNSTAQADLRNIVQAQESVVLDRGRYWDCMNNGCNDPGLPGMSLSEGMTMVCAPGNGGAKFQCASRHQSSNSMFFFDSEFKVYWEIFL
jgi:type IV pilus assembly protein PilA